MKSSLLRRLGYRLFGLFFLSLANMACSETSPAWELYKNRFITHEGRVVDTGNNSISHSEGQGWGMILAVAANDRETFSRIWDWTQRTLTRTDARLFSWRYDPRQTPAVSDPNNATDGDLFIAWALSLAGERWGDYNYLIASEAIRDDIKEHLVRDVGGYKVLLPGLNGFEGQEYVDVNLSYWFMPALLSFAREDPSGPWQTLVDDGRRLLTDGRFGSLRLPVDWMRLSSDGELQPAPTFPTRFSFDAVRIPLYFGWVGYRGDSGLAGIADFWSAGTRSPAWVDVVSGELAPFPVSFGVAAVQAVIAGSTPQVSTALLEKEDYYSSSLMLLSLVASKRELLGSTSAARNLLTN